MASIDVFIDWWPYARRALAPGGPDLGARCAAAPAERPLAAVAVTVLAVAYTGALPAFLLAIRHGGFGGRIWAGTWLVFFPLVVTWVCDTAAMFGGRAIGGPKLAPTVSPGKTRSGSIAGVVGGLLWRRSSRPGLPRVSASSVGSGICSSSSRR